MTPILRLSNIFHDEKSFGSFIRERKYHHCLQLDCETWHRSSFLAREMSFAHPADVFSGLAEL